MTTGDVQMTIQDGGANTQVVLPAQEVQVVIGCAAGGSAAVNQIVSTRNPATLQSSFLAGPLMEAAGLVVLAGGTVLAIAVPISTKGSAYTPVTTGTGTALSHVAVTLDSTVGAFDDYYVLVKIVKGGTLGTAGIQFQLSLDAGRNFGPVLSLGTALTYVIPNTGITLTMGTSSTTYVTGDSWQFGTVGPAWNDAGISAALTALQGSQYALSGWGSLHIVGVSGGSDGNAFNNGSTGYLDVLQNGSIFTRAIIDARDAHAPVAWGGAGETESTWMSSLQTDFGGTVTNGKRLCVNGGHYNTPTAFPTSVCGSPAYRRSLGWSLAVRQVQIPPQRHAGRVKDGALGTILVNATTDPTDGFIYHDERVNPGLDAARFCSARTRKKKAGFFIDNPNLFSPPGSQFTLLPLGNVMDIACDIAFAVGEDDINDDVRLNANGTLYPTDALAIQNNMLGEINANMTAQGEISSATVVVDQSANVGSTSKVPVNISIVSRGYILEEDITIGFASPNAAGG